MVTACIVLLYISYCIPVICLLVKGRDNIRHGPFWLGKFGLFTNWVTIIWTIFTLIMYSFPFVKPVLPDSKFFPSFSSTLGLFTPLIRFYHIHIPASYTLPSPPLCLPLFLSTFIARRVFGPLPGPTLPLQLRIKLTNKISNYISFRHELRFGSILGCICLRAHLLGGPREAYIPD